MSWRFRKTKSFGPIRMTLSKKGLSYSVGGNALRYTVRADGKRQITTKIPGTGISRTETLGGSPRANIGNRSNQERSSNSVSTYYWRCPECSNELELRKRITQSKRTCPECGTQITTEEIDKQLGEKLAAQAENERLRMETERLRMEQVRAGQAAGAATLGRLFLIGIVIFLVFGAFSRMKTFFQLRSLKEASQSQSAQPSLLSSQASSMSSDHKPEDVTSPSNQKFESVSPAVEEPTSAPLVASNNLDSAAQPARDSSASTETLIPLIDANSSTSYTIDPPADGVAKVESIILNADGDIEGALGSLAEGSIAGASQAPNEERATALNKVGLVVLKQKDYPRAASYFASALSLVKDDPKYLSNLGFTQMWTGNLENARKNLLQSILIAPRRSVAWSDLGLVYAKMHEQSKAVECLVIGYKISEDKSLNYLKSLDKDDDVAVRLAGSLALERAKATLPVGTSQ